MPGANRENRGVLIVPDLVKVKRVKRSLKEVKTQNLRLGEMKRWGGCNYWQKKRRSGGNMGPGTRGLGNLGVPGRGETARNCPQCWKGGRALGGNAVTGAGHPVHGTMGTC